MKTLIATLAFCLAALALPAQAQLLYQEGRNYTVLPVPVPTSDPNKVEVVEAFWYGCPHCYHFEPLVEAWKKKLPDYVNFVALPVVWSNLHALHAQAMYTAEALGVLDKMHPAFFHAMQEEKKPLKTEDEIAELFQQAAGIDRETFMKAFKSFGVASKLKQAAQRTRDYQVTGTPSLVVNGKYLVTANQNNGHEGMLKVADYLISVESQSLRVKAAADQALSLLPADDAAAASPEASKKE